ncbi:MAG: HD-GYP domain-containing protein [Rhodocyclaceae bacterium]|nr:HD-GYP domain-containing protein [Rhodocyclaceae bacterium]
MTKHGQVCAYCGSDVRKKPFLRLDDGLHCERCFLRRHIEAPHDEAYTLLAEGLAAALDLRERETGLHSKRVACHTLVMGRHVTGDPEFLRQLYWGGLLHDIGKIGVPDAVLLKHGALSDAEWVQIRTHPYKGYEILAPVPGLSMAAQIVLAHEERYDGSGYPQGLRGNEIPHGARLFAVIDTLDAITSDRPYRRAQDFDQAVAEIVKGAGSQFDPDAVEVFLAEESSLRRMVKLKCIDPQAAAAEFE